ncbi:hypothetical protein NLU13_2333 [Sarocladium strictum]|uniref:Zn(2)-C6 fungal-type domain-containing protein n=1 Tax=Sarocladium strictum TaxID=5046 RepID=A0AA39LDC7_SARSR|nr:hypothetical protein NLU13_2333 [Sarocladium strictum]
MTRKGSEKRRTGCITCKKRRVKCDEGRPTCLRCRRGARECSYAEPPVGCYSWDHLLQSKSPSPPLSHRVSGPVARNLDFFRCVVAPKIGGELSSSSDFWTTAVMQLAMTEDAAMHGLQAISLLYKDFTPGWGSSGENEAALQQYNRALRAAASRELGTMAVLILSVIFTCIEFLRGNEAAAITHCRHGTLVSRLADAKQDSVQAMLQQLSVFPHFFSIGGFPELEPVRRAVRFETLPQAALAMDDLMGQAVRLVRSMDAYRLGFEGAEMPAHARETQLSLLGNLSCWKTAYCDLGSRIGEETPGHPLLMMRFRVCWVWACIALEREETANDAYHAEFADILNLGSKAVARESDVGNFSFSMGMSPLLHFIVVKCRHLPMRLQALELLRSRGRRRESLWDTETMCRIGELIIQREHGIMAVPGVEVAQWEYPAEEKRIRDSYVEDEVFLHTDDFGHQVSRRRIYLFVREGGMTRKEAAWISLQPS